jgi:hypothetical protein
MTRRDTLQCAHEPFGDSFYYGPERLSERYENDESAREKSGFSKTTYRDVLERLEKDGSEVRHFFIYPHPPVYFLTSRSKLRLLSAGETRFFDVFVS